ncbi:MAG: YceI family protein [Chloroflexi bacterium]|nr:YceI family protein [Chloroflexota bacterium]
MSTQAQPKQPATWVMDPAHTSIEFAVRHMMISTVRGRFTKFDVDADFNEVHPERSRVEVRIDASSIDTKEPQRDAHLRSPDFLDVARYSALTFKSRRVEPRGDGRYRMVGDLTIRGVTREVAVEGVYAGIVKDPMGNQHAGFTAETTVNRKDFDLTWNMVLEAGKLLVGDTAKITIEAELVKKVP